MKLLDLKRLDLKKWMSDIFEIRDKKRGAAEEIQVSQIRKQSGLIMIV